MKCIDIRLGTGSNDVEDVRKLALVCNIKDADEALKIVESFYPLKRIPPKTSLALEEIFQALDTSQQLAAGRAGFDLQLARHKLLRRAWFDNQGLISLNATMLKESPLAFRRRFIFTEAQPLRRA